MKGPQSLELYLHTTTVAAKALVQPAEVWIRQSSMTVCPCPDCMYCRGAYCVHEKNMPQKDIIGGTLQAQNSLCSPALANTEFEKRATEARGSSVTVEGREECKATAFE